MKLSMLYTHWQAAWMLDVMALSYAALYAWAAARLGSRWPARRTLSFLGGVVCVLVAVQSGIGFYDDQLLSVHMVQHMLLLLVAPLLVLGGRPVLLALRVLSPRRRAPLTAALRHLRAFTGPTQSLVIFAAVIVLTHLPGFYDATLREAALHDAEHIVYLAAGLIMWTPLLDADPLMAHRLSGLGRLVYMLATMPAMALIGAYLNRHPTLVYPAYGTPAKTLGVSALTDQQQAGAIMWVAGSTVIVAIGLWASVAALVAEERRLRAREQRAIGGQTT